MKWDLTSFVKPRKIHHGVNRAQKLLLDQGKWLSGMEIIGKGENTD